MQEDEQRRQSQIVSKSVSFMPATTETDSANRLADSLNNAESVNSTWWGANNRASYAMLLRWYAKAPGPSSPSGSSYLATCYYQMEMYPDWEKEQKRLGLVPAREIEKLLRWDGVSEMGEGYQVITKYQLEHDMSIAYVQKGY